MTDAVGSSALSKGMASCHTCLKLSPIELHHCPRCGSTMHARETDSLQRCVALLITACILYIPANVLPIMYTDQLGSTEASTIIGDDGWKSMVERNQDEMVEGLGLWGVERMPGLKRFFMKHAMGLVGDLPESFRKAG